MNMYRLILFAAICGLGLGKSCMECICQLESRCTNLPCRMDAGSLSCGYYQLKKAYFVDCGQPEKKRGESEDAAWKRCAASKSCSEKCIKTYINRYKSRCSGMSECQTMARLHNGGLNGCTNSRTGWYWNKIKEHGCL